MTRKIDRSPVSRLFTIAAVAAAMAVAACGGDGSEPVDEPAGALNANVCAVAAKAGRVDICHTGEEAQGDIKALTVTEQACGTEHARHLEDFVASPETGCKQAKPARCKPAGTACSFSRAAECCSLACILLPGNKKPTCG